MPRPKAKRTFDTLRFSIEAEVEYPNTKDSSKLIEKHRIIRGWDISYDGSLDNGSEYKPKDKNKLYWNEDCIDQIKEIIGLIKAHKGNSGNGTAGLHCHIDMSQFSYKEICNIVKAFIKQQNKIYKQFNVLKCRYDYAQKIPKNTLKYITENNIKKVKDGSDSCRDINEYLCERHYGLNILALEKYNTLEFRFFNSSIQISNIKRAIKFCLNFCLDNAKGGK